MALVYIMNFVPEGDYHHDFPDVFGNIAIMTALYIICRMILSRIQELINTAIEETMLREQLAHETTLDSLTKLYNHAAFYKRLDEPILSYQKNNAKRFALILMDIDDFKKINDTYGHTTGDQVILRLVEVIKKNDADDLAFRI